MMRVAHSLTFASCIVLALVLLTSSCVSAQSRGVHGDDESFTVVGARVVTCMGCRLNSLPRIRSFLENEARSYPALSIDYHHGKDPELQFLDKHRRVVSTYDMAPLSPLQIAQLLNNNGIHTWTPAPVYAAPEFHETKHCVAFRQTGECSPLGPREPTGDAPCLAIIDEMRSGICECKGEGKKNIELACGHEAETCDKLCDPNGEHSDENSIPQPPDDSDL